jgi:hypothetical protein
MNRKRVVACMALTLCAPVGVLALYGPHPWPSLNIQASASNSQNYIRIELPPVQIIGLDQSTGFDVAAVGQHSAVAIQPGAIGDELLQLAPGIEAQDQTRAPAQVRSAPILRPTAADGLMDVSFDLAQPRISDRAALEVRKGVRFNGADAGQATIRVGTGSAVFIAIEDLRALLSAARRVDLADRLTSGTERPFVGFDEIRQAGVNLRYDAASDQIVISG